MEHLDHHTGGVQSVRTGEPLLVPHCTGDGRGRNLRARHASERSSVYEEHLAKHGEGFHHTCLVYPTLEAVREAKTELRRQGRELIQEGSAGNVFDFGYFLFPEIGSAVEVLYLDVAKLPPPEAVIRASS